MTKQGDIVAKSISCNDVPHMWENGNERPGLCPICHNVLEQIPNMEYKVRKTKSRDLVVTYDGFYIVSQKFKNFCDENNYEDLTFIQLPKSPQYYFFLPRKIYKLDYVRMKTKFIGYKSCCGQYEAVCGYVNFYRDKENDIEGNDFICCADFLFAEHLIKTPIVIIGSKTLDKMIEFGLSGFHGYNVYE
jgi:hypothetical protein